MSDSPLLQPEEHVLSTLERDGSRRWLRPRLSHGRLLTSRRAVAYALIALYTLLPFVKIDGKPFVLLDLPARRFTIFGFTFLPTDTLLLALAVVAMLVGVFLLTALLGRVWCGWACPQTVYMEFVFRPIERLFAGTAGKGGAPPKNLAAWRTVARTATYLFVSFYLANVLLAYFVGVDELWRWMRQSPREHPIPFVVMSVVTALMMIDFTYFREQMCILACPYGRLQSVLLDDRSLIVAYDGARGEPRGKVRHGEHAGLPVVGDCVDCKLCVQTCPTGIDIRNGLQMECINCAQCIDACDAVMKKIGRAPRLVRYSSQARDRGEGKKLLRGRVLAYPIVMTVLAGLFVAVLVGKQSFDVVALRGGGQPYTTSDDGRVRNVLRLKVTNRVEETRAFTVSVVGGAAADIAIETPTGPIEVAPDAMQTVPVSVLAPPSSFRAGQRSLELQVSDDSGEARTVEIKMLGP
jgi:cytochrome c oxidase accessory protein FixG